ncbi:MAG: cyclic nucleotide-binding domain-containing protein [Bacteroidota bacterium]
MNHIIKSIRELTKCNDIDLQKIQTTLDRRKLKKNDFLLKSGQVCRQYYFVESGTIRLFYTKNHIEYTVWMGTAGEIFTNLESYLDASPSRINIQAIEPSVTYTITKKESDQLARELNTYNTLLRRTVETAFIGLSKNVMSFQSDEALERYQRVVNEKNWIERYPLKYISTFIGVTQSTLSRIRAKRD